MVFSFKAISLRQAEPTEDAIANEVAMFQVPQTATASKKSELAEA